MSKIEQLIKKFCPKGVERVPLSHAVKIKRGVRVVKQQLKDVGLYPVFQNCLTSMGFYDRANCPAGTAFVIAAGAAGSVGYSDVDFWAADDCYYMVTPENVNGKYLYYALKSKEHLLFAKVRKASVPRLAREVVESVEIAFPPRPVQDEIVKALDAMDAVVKALEEERKARFEQFEAMRDKLLKFANGGGYCKITIGDIGRVAMCKRILKQQTSKSGEVPFFKIGTFGRHPDAYISKELFDEYRTKYSYPVKGAILLSAAGTIGRSVVFDGEESYYQDSNIVWLEHDESMVLNRYLYFWYQLNPWKVSKGGTIERLYNDNILQTEIVLPPLSEQKKIVAKLDAFSAVVTALDEEIAARREQFAGWLEKLMEFREAA